MGAPSVGDVVIIPFPYSDLSQSKRRPALVLAEAGRGVAWSSPGFVDSSHATLRAKLALI